MMTTTPRQLQPCSGYVLVRLLRPVWVISLRLQSTLSWHETREAAMRQQKAQRHKMAVDSTTSRRCVLVGIALTAAAGCRWRLRSVILAAVRAPAIRSSVGACRLDGSGESVMTVRF